MSKLRVMLVDDHAMIRSGLTMAINSQADMEVVGQAASGREAIAQARCLQPDVVVMDVSLPDFSGAEATEVLCRELPAVRVLVFTRHGDPGYLRRLLQAGADGYMLKSADANTMLGALRTVAAGGTYIDPTLAGDLVTVVLRPAATNAKTQDPPGDLTARERDVLRLIAWGRSNKEIAAQFGISIKTVEYYKAQAIDKLELHSRTDIIRYALSQGWLHADQEPE